MVKRKNTNRMMFSEEEDPMAGTSNLVDAMLVIALGFLIMVVMSWNMQSIVFSDMSADERQEIMETINEIYEVHQGQELNSTPESVSTSGDGYSQLGTVYKDPSTGNLILVVT